MKKDKNQNTKTAGKKSTRKQIKIKTKNSIIKQTKEK